MANPQKEDGYTSIANEIMDQFCRYFPGWGEGQVLTAILRKTYGWRKKEDSITISQLQESTGLSRRRVIVCIQNLEAKKMITVKRQRGRGNINLPNVIAFQKNYENWVVTEKSDYYHKDLESRKNRYRKSKEIVVTEIKGSDGNGKKVVTEMVNNVQFPSPTKETITKEIIQKKSRKVLMADEDFWKEIRKIYTWVDIDKEIAKMKGYMLSPRGKRWRMTQQRVIEWLGRIDKPLELPNGKSW